MVKSDKVSYFAGLFLGAFFVFSALAKGLDVFAVSAKMQDYARVFDFQLPNVVYGLGALFLIGIELMIGLLLIKGVYRRFVVSLTLILLISFLILTFFVAILGDFNDCGCFGSVVSTSPWMSFAKNLILLILAILSYPWASDEIQSNSSDLFVCIFLPLILCGLMVFNQPLMDASKFCVGDRLSINTEARGAIDVDFLSEPVLGVRNIGIIRHMDDKSVTEVLDNIADRKPKPIVLTSTIPTEVPTSVYEYAIVGFIDNSVLNSLISSEYGIIMLDSNATIISKWQKDQLNLQSPKTDLAYSQIARTAFILVFIVIGITAIYITIRSIMRGCRKTHQRVGNKKQLL